ncbi:predicted protein [Coccidioides posadasii str. Silveira]|uniref:Predicted protein n=1 Tax=Coccidioides posadasii (strain RMSCC 757 / Silveira) TaxID=443226 RepID=E9CSG6_COCPS|nr:predicted protein [Coccidioides posadasii str. Silveira]
MAAMSELSLRIKSSEQYGPSRMTYHIEMWCRRESTFRVSGGAATIITLGLDGELP